VTFCPEYVASTNEWHGWPSFGAPISSILKEARWSVAMMKQLTPNRPAMAAIAAVIAFSSTPALAQEAPVVTPPTAVTPPPADPVAVTPAMPAAAPTAPAAPVASAPAPAAANAPVFKAPAEVVQTTPPAPPVVAEAAPEAPVHAERAPHAERTAGRDGAQGRPVQRVAAPESVSARAVPAAPTPATQPAPELAAPIAAAPAPVAPVDVAPVDFAPAAPVTRTAGVDNGVMLGMGAGLILLLGAGIAFAMRRRRADSGAVVDYDEAHMIKAAPSASYAEPVYAPTTAQILREPVAEPEAVRAARSPVAHSAPVGQHGGSIEAMVAERPSPANPFLTRKNRLRRAQFLMRKAETPTAPLPPTAQGKPSVTVRIDRSRQVYDFGGVSNRRRPFKPATT
jgi:hypothetical protein